MVNSVTPRPGFKPGCNGVRISVKVKPNSKQGLVTREGENRYTVRVKEKAVEGRANDAVIEELSEYFGVPRRRISLVRGIKSRNKIFDIFP
ncbi:MAG: DUF167 domain-containing protein [Candidatus Omnitrophota bacterium]